MDRQAVEQALAVVGLVDCAGRDFSTLSGGEKQRALLARALAQAPQLLVLDEPTSHLDIRHQRDILRLVRGLGVSVLASLHDLNQAAAYCDRLCLLSDGAIAASGVPATVLTAPLIARIFEIDCCVESDSGTGRLAVRYES
jgi:iron complex transport system ATP-binding protein